MRNADDGWLSASLPNPLPKSSAGNCNPGFEVSPSSASIVFEYSNRVRRRRGDLPGLGASHDVSTTGGFGVVGVLVGAMVSVPGVVTTGGFDGFTTPDEGVGAPFDGAGTPVFTAGDDGVGQVIPSDSPPTLPEPHPAASSKTAVTPPPVRYTRGTPRDGFVTPRALAETLSRLDRRRTSFNLMPQQ